MRNIQNLIEKNVSKSGFTSDENRTGKENDFPMVWRQKSVAPIRVEIYTKMRISGLEVGIESFGGFPILSFNVVNDLMYELGYK